MLTKILTNVIKEDKAKLITYCAELWTENGSLYIGATDLMTTIIAKHPNFDGQLDHIVVSLPLLHQVLESLPSEKVKLKVLGDNLIVNDTCVLPIKKRIGKLPLARPTFDAPKEIDLGLFKTLKKYHKVALTNDDLMMYYIKNGEITTNTNIIVKTNLLDDIGISLLSSYAADKLSNFKGMGLFESFSDHTIGVQTNEYSMLIKEKPIETFPIDSVKPFLGAETMIEFAKKDFQTLVTLIHKTKWTNTKLTIRNQLYVQSEDESLGGSLDYTTTEQVSSNSIIVPTKSVYDTLKSLGKTIKLGIFPNFICLQDDKSKYIIARTENE